MPVRRFRRGRTAKAPIVLISDPRVEGWETVTTFEDERTAVAWRDQLRHLGVDACQASPLAASACSVAW
jgi:hypothetical protein